MGKVCNQILENGLSCQQIAVIYFRIGRSECFDYLCEDYHERLRPKSLIDQKILEAQEKFTR